MEEGLIYLNNDKEDDVAEEEPVKGKVIGSESEWVGRGRCRFHRASQTNLRTLPWAPSDVGATESFRAREWRDLICSPPTFLWLL